MGRYVAILVTTTTLFRISRRRWPLLVLTIYGIAPKQYDASSRIPARSELAGEHRNNPKFDLEVPSLQQQSRTFSKVASQIFSLCVKRNMIRSLLSYTYHCFSLVKKTNLSERREPEEAGMLQLPMQSSSGAADRQSWPTWSWFGLLAC